MLVLLYFFFNCFIFFIWLCCTAFGISVSWPGMEPVCLASEGWSLNHWTTREVLVETSWVKQLLITFLDLEGNEDIFRLSGNVLQISWPATYTGDIIAQPGPRGHLSLCDSSFHIEKDEDLSYRWGNGGRRARGDLSEVSHLQSGTAGPRSKAQASFYCLQMLLFWNRGELWWERLAGGKGWINLLIGGELSSDRRSPAPGRATVRSEL